MQGDDDSKPEELPELTARQHHFVRELLAGRTSSDAYRRAYSAENSKPETIHANACRLANNAKIKAWVAAGRTALMGGASVSRENHLRELERLRELALAANKHSAAVQAEMLRGKVAGFYVEQYADVSAGDPITALNSIAELAPELAADLARREGISWRPGGAAKH